MSNDNQLREALRKLTAEAKAIVDSVSGGYALRQLVGNTNISVLQLRIGEADKALQAYTTGVESLIPSPEEVATKYFPNKNVQIWRDMVDAIRERDQQHARAVAKDSQRELTLRKRIHALELHNQWFERCESAWCNPSPDNDPSFLPHGDRAKMPEVIRDRKRMAEAASHLKSALQVPISISAPKTKEFVAYVRAALELLEGKLVRTQQAPTNSAT